MQKMGLVCEYYISIFCSKPRQAFVNCIPGWTVGITSFPTAPIPIFSQWDGRFEVELLVHSAKCNCCPPYKQFPSLISWYISKSSQNPKELNKCLHIPFTTRCNSCRCSGSSGVVLRTVAARSPSLSLDGIQSHLTPPLWALSCHVTTKCIGFRGHLGFVRSYLSSLEQPFCFVFENCP